MDPRIGTEFAGHRIESVIGRGGASVVYLAEHLRLGRKVALKVLAPHLADDEAFRERFIRESRIAAGLDHPNIVTVYDAGEVEGSLYISMRLVEGSDLGKVLAAEGALEPARAVSILSQIASALDAAHAQGLVHRDVKPANILVTTSADMPDFDRAYLSDFGISKRTTSREGLTRTGQFVGTVDYVAPEQITGEPVDGRTDVYSLGCVLFECLSGRVPFPGETGVATIYSHLHDRPPALEGFGERGRRLDRVLARALAKSKEARYDACGDVVEAVRAELTAVAAGRGGTPAAGDHRAGAHRPSSSGGPRRAVGIAVAAVIVALAVIALALVLPDGDGTEGAEEPEGTAPTGPVTGGTGETGTDVADLGAPPRFIWTPAYTTEGSGLSDAAITDAVVMGDLVLAVGHGAPQGQPGTLHDAAVWRSEDGRSWRRIGQGSLAADGDQRMIAITVFEGLLVAGGFSDSDAAVWTSADLGETWTRSGSTTFGAFGLQRIRDFVTMGSELVAVGSEGLPNGQDAAVWTSSDGLDWDAVDDPGLEAPGDQEVMAARELGDRLVAVGITNELGDIDGAVWVFESGAWSRVPPESLASPDNQEVILDIAGGGGDHPLVAVGCEDPSYRCDTLLATAANAVVWTSDDGSSWVRVEATGRLQGPGDQVMRALVTYHGSLVAVGSRGGPRGDIDGGVWTSVDGVAWRSESQSSPNVTALGGEGSQSMRGVIVYRQRLIGFGVTQVATVVDGRLWVAAEVPA
jgi:serine/threonine-protein kinase